jgi:integrase
VLGLRWADIDMDAGTATIARQLVEHPESRGLGYRPTKRPRSKATIGLHPSTVAALRRRRSNRASAGSRWDAEWPSPTRSMATSCSRGPMAPPSGRPR